MLVISVYWFAAQKQTATHTRERSPSTSSKFCVEENELTPSFQNPPELARKLQKVNKTQWKLLKNCENQTMLEKRKYMYFAV